MVWDALYVVHACLISRVVFEHVKTFKKVAQNLKSLTNFRIVLQFCTFAYLAVSAKGIEFLSQTQIFQFPKL